MLRIVAPITKPNGSPVHIPVHMDESQLDYFVKRFIEIAGYNLQDGSGYAAHFRSFHGGTWTKRILEAALAELRAPSIELCLEGTRDSLIPFFAWVMERHQTHSDAEFGYPQSPERMGHLPT